MEQLLFKGKKKSKLMEEMMIISTTTKSLPNQSIPTFTPWKHYHNAIFIHHPPHPQPPPPTYKNHRQQCCNCTQTRTHRRRPSAFRDLSFNMAAATTKSTKTELESARAQIIELKTELELERKLRKKVEYMAKRMAKELAEERRSREVAERLCDELENRVSLHRAEIDRIEREMEEERRMLRVAEVIREERVQMKLEDAKLFYEEKMIILEQCRKTGEEDKPIKVAEESACMGERKRWVSAPPENPHIKRGIKGFVEFPRGARAAGSNRSNRNYKIECQKAQLRILLKQRSLVLPHSLAIS